MLPLLVAIGIVSLVSLIFNVGYIVHELGLFPHTKDRSTPVDRKHPFRSRYERDVRATHSFQTMDPKTIILRKFGHADLYKMEDPYLALGTAIQRYEERQTRSRYDDLIHLSNYICNYVRCDEKINAMIGDIHRLIHAKPIEGN